MVRQDRPAPSSGSTRKSSKVYWLIFCAVSTLLLLLTVWNLFR